MAEVESNRENKLCASCQLPSGLFCGRCRVTPYCSVECQKESWRMHKKACKLNNPTPSAGSVAVITGNDDFGRLYSYIIISGAKKGAANSLLDTIARLKGVNDFNPLHNVFKWANFEDTIVPGFSLEDRSIFRVIYCEQSTLTRTDDTENNLANQLIMKQNCRGSFVVYKMDSVDSALRSNADAEDSTEAETSSQPGVTSTKDSKGIKLIPLSRREIWEIINYRYECSSIGVVSDRIHRTNMQRTEALLALKKTGFTCVGPFNESGPSTFIR